MPKAVFGIGSTPDLDVQPEGEILIQEFVPLLLQIGNLLLQICNLHTKRIPRSGHDIQGTGAIAKLIDLCQVSIYPCKNNVLKFGFFFGIEAHHSTCFRR
jgi:hypothetical protein